MVPTNLFSIVQLFASIGTFVTAIIVVLTLLEMKEQRRNSTRPDIVVSRAYYKVYITDDSSIGNTRWVTGKSYKECLPTQLCFNEATLKMYNIGLAAAKDVKIEWQYDINKMIEIINNDRNNDYPNKIDNGILRLKDSLSIIHQSDDFDYLMPVNISNESVSFILPPDYIRLTSMLVLFDIKDFINKDEYYMMNPPEIMLFISYNDISNNYYIKKFKISLRLGSINIKNIKSTEPVIIGEIKVKHVI